MARGRDCKRLIVSCTFSKMRTLRAADMFPILFGWRTVEWRSEGEFHCQICREKRSYSLIKSARYFHIFFIPIVPLEEPKEAVECHECGRQFEKSALSHNPGPSPKERLLARVIDELAAGKSVEEVRDKLTQPGLSADLLQRAIERALDGSVRTCERCRLHFSKSARICKECGDALLEG